MKFDLHCHTKEGSFDSSVSVAEYVEKFKELGYDGFMITDHNSYKGCRHWNRIKKLPQYRDFTVICGIEYDTKDAGHVLVVMPDGVFLPLLKIRGMRLSKLIHVVHLFGGILGLAHPFGIPSSSAMGFKLMKKELIDHLDFLEGFNTCERSLSNLLARDLAEHHGLACFGGSDSHKSQYIGTAYTEINADIRNNNDFIAAVKAGLVVNAGCTERKATLKGKAKEHFFSVLGYKLYNRGIAKLRFTHRRYAYNRLVDDSNLSNQTHRYN